MYSMKHGYNVAFCEANDYLNINQPFQKGTEIHSHLLSICTFLTDKHKRNISLELFK